MREKSRVLPERFRKGMRLKTPFLASGSGFEAWLSLKSQIVCQCSPVRLATRRLLGWCWLVRKAMVSRSLLVPIGVSFNVEGAQSETLPAVFSPHDPHAAFAAAHRMRSAYCRSNANCKPTPSHSKASQSAGWLTSMTLHRNAARSRQPGATRANFRTRVLLPSLTSA